VDHERQWL